MRKDTGKTQKIKEDKGRRKEGLRKTWKNKGEERKGRKVRRQAEEGRKKKGG